MYFFYGTNIEKRRAALENLFQTLRGDKKELEIFRKNGEELNASGLDELTQSRGLFAENFAVLLENILINSDNEELILGKLEDLKESPNVFIIVESEPGKKFINSLKKAAVEVHDFTEIKNKAQEFNVFSLTDAFGERNKKNLWINLQKSISADAKPEEIQGILFWQIKNMILAQETSPEDHKNLNLNPFVLKKSLMFSRNFENAELKQLSSKLIENYHEARRGQDPMVGLERLILENL